MYSDTLVSVTGKEEEKKKEKKKNMEKINNISKQVKMVDVKNKSIIK